MEDVYSSVPFDINSTGNFNLVLDVLKSNKGKFFTSSTLSKIGMYKKTDTSVELRQDITKAIMDGFPIISGPTGFSWARIPNQVKHYIEKLEERKQGLQRRIDNLQEIYENMKGEYNE